MRWLAREIDTFVAYLRSGAKASLGVGDTTADPFQRQLADLVHLHSSEAMMVTDPQHRITLVNPAFIRMTGYAAEEVIGRDPSFLNSVRHDSAFYRQLRRAVESAGHWQGEIWSQRKSGESFPGWLSIHTAFDPAGAVQQRVTLLSDGSHHKASEALVWRQANFDSLTQLPNRNMLKDRLAEELKKARRDGRAVAVLAIQLDHFAGSQEMQDQDWSDRLIVEAAGRVVACVRTTDSVARIASDGFTALLTGLGGADTASQIAQNIVHSLAQPFELDTALVVLSASVGITVYPSDAAPVDTMLLNAHQAMAAARQEGGNQYSFFTPSLQRAAEKRLQLIRELRVAVGQQQFCLHFQPIVELATGTVCKAEALVRWQHPTRGLINPGEFIALAEEYRLIGDIGDWVFKEAARWAQRWRASHCPNFQVSVNKSPAQFGRARNHAAGWIDHLRQLGLPGNAVALEITEGLMLNKTPAIDDCLRSYRDAGMQLAIDDFGTGYSSLSYLKNLAFDYLKIDRSFIGSLAPGASELALCEAIVVMAHKLGLKVVAEGIETAAQRDLLIGMGCDYGQGYFFDRPLAPEAFERSLQARRQAPHQASVT